jgi:hypothetical protein
MRIIFITLLFLSVGKLCAQGVTISGRIVDTETLDPLPFAHVFIDQTTIGTVSDANGEYIIEHVENGDYKIVFSFLGYELYYKTISVNGSDMRVSARLVPSKEMLESVEVSGTKDKEWEKQLKQFNRVFFGDTDMARDCKILNPWVLDFRIDWDHSFKATASDVLKIENRAMGYSIDCTLQGFSFDKKGYKIRGLYKFNELNTLDKKEAMKWTRNRRMAYQGSMRFLFKSIIENHESENGFEIYSDLRPSLTTQTSGYFSNELGKSVKPLDLSLQIHPVGRPGYYQISVPDRLEIHHTTQFAQVKTYRDVTYPVSWIETEKGYVMVSQDGNIVNNEHITTSGELNHNRIATMLPLNYSPGTMVVINYLTKRAQAKRLQERAYVQTDKGFYYPGETIWFKTYTNYANQSVRDSLSSVLYVDLISPSKKIMETKILRLDSAYAHGEFQLSHGEAPGIYFVRVYTKWMLNYGSEIIYYKPIGVLQNDLAVKTRYPAESNEDFIITSSLNRFSWPGKMEWTTQLDSTYDNFFANCSISVSPLELQLPYELDINEALQFKDEMPISTLAEFTYPLEYGFSIQGQLFRPKKKSTTGIVTVIQGKMDSVYHIRTDRKGNFTLENLDFFDTLSFSFQGRDKKNRIFGSTKILPDEKPLSQPPKIYLNKLELDSVKLNHPIVIVQEIKQDSVSRPIVKAKAEVTDANYINPNANYILNQSDLEKMPQGINIIDALVMRVPGLQLNPGTGQLSLNRRSSPNEEGEPLIVVDGIPLNLGTNTLAKNSETEKSSGDNQQSRSYSNSANPETSGANDINTSNNNQVANKTNINNTYQQPVSLIKDMVGHITVDYVTRVEVMLRGNAQFSSSSSNGVIAIYTRKTPLRVNQDKAFQSVLMQGFSRPKDFHVPIIDDTSGQNYNPQTVYWNPSIHISAKEETRLSIETPRKPGRYLLRIEGMSYEGNPVSGSLIFNVEKSLDQTQVKH